MTDIQAVDLFGDVIEDEPTEEIDKPYVPSLFDILNDINVDKRGIVSRETMEGYSVFAVSRGLSQHMDTLLLVNELNKHGVTDPKMHYDYLMATVVPKKRFGKWAKAEEKDEATIANVANYFQVSHKQAEEYMDIMDKSQVKKINEQYNEGGKNGKLKSL